MQPASQSSPMETKECGPRDGNRWASVAWEGRPLIGRLPIFVDSMVLPSGSDTRMGVWVARTLIKSVLSIVKKCPVLPVSAIFLFVIGVVGGSFCSVGGSCFTIILFVTGV